MPKILVIEGCVINHGDDRGGVVYSVGEVADVTKEAASALARAGRALYVRREDDASKGGYTASAEILQAAGLAEPPVPVAPPADPGAKK